MYLIVFMIFHDHWIQLVSSKLEWCWCKLLNIWKWSYAMKVSAIWLGCFSWKRDLNASEDAPQLVSAWEVDANQHRHQNHLKCFVVVLVCEILLMYVNLIGSVSGDTFPNMLCTQSKKHITGRIPNDSTNASTTRTMVKSQVKHPLSHPFSGISVTVGRPQRGIFLEGTGYSNGSGFEHLGEQALIQDGESENPETFKEIGW